MRRYIIALVLFSLFYGPAYALTVTLSGTQFIVSYTEPAVNADGTPLHDLHHTTIYYQIGMTAPVRLIDVNATTPEGGQIVTGTVTVPVPENAETVVRIFVSASDVVGNESGKSVSNDQLIDHLPPGAPQ